MFCYNCGKEIFEKSTFCTWCGTKQILVGISAPVPTETPRTDPQSKHEQPEDSIQLPTARQEAPTESAPELTPSESAAEPLHEPTAPQSEQPPLQDSTPSIAPESTQEPTAPTAPTPAQTEQSAQPETTPQPENRFGGEVPLTTLLPEEKPRKFYTGAHLAICLVITGIMATVAGIFAGLYFSVI